LLDATVSDDALPTGTLTSAWSKVSGPGLVTFGDSTSIDTTAAFSRAGAYVLRLSVSDGVLVTSDDVQVLVNKAILEVRAPNLNRVYGTANPLLIASITGYQNGDTADAISGSAVLATAATETSSLGNYPIIVDVSSMTSANYEFKGVNGVLTITQATPVITWANPAAMIYGTPLSAMQLNAITRVAGSFVYTPSLGSILHAGSGQALSVVFTPTDTVNYATANATTALTVNQASLIITADNKTMVSGQAVPALTAVGSGLVSPDTLANLDTAAVLTTTATNSSATGTYPITVSGASDSDYVISYVNGTMSVTAGGGGSSGSGSNGSSGGEKCGLGGGFGAMVFALLFVIHFAFVRRREKVHLKKMG
jgi:hypothetical protein